MRLGVVSDTHMPRFGEALPKALERGLRAAGVDLLVHLGDFTSPDVPALFEAIAPLEAVAGNNDPSALVRRFGRRKILDVAGVRMGLVHGDEGPGSTTPERALRSFLGSPDGPVAVVLFGHSHIPLLERRDGILLLNPGSPTDKRRQPMFSYAVLDVGPERIDAWIERYPDRSP